MFLNEMRVTRLDYEIHLEVKFHCVMVQVIDNDSITVWRHALYGDTHCTANGELEIFALCGDTHWTATYFSGSLNSDILYTFTHIILTLNFDRLVHQEGGVESLSFSG